MIIEIIKKNIYSNVQEEHMAMDDEELSNEQLSITTIVYSGRFRSYPIEDFKNLGLILKRVNHSVWFGI